MVLPSHTEIQLLQWPFMISALLAWQCQLLSVQVPIYSTKILTTQLCCCCFWLLHGNLLSFGSAAFCTVTFQADISCKAPDSVLPQTAHLSFLHRQSLSWCCFPVSVLVVLAISSHYALLTAGTMLGIPVVLSRTTTRPYSQLIGYRVKLEKSFILF